VWGKKRGDVMLKPCLSLISALIFINVLAVGVAESADGTLRLTFKLKKLDGTEQGLSYAYVYLRDAAELPPMEKFFSPPDYIFGPTNLLGELSVNVPEGQYYLRVTGRNPFQDRPLGPPGPGDYSWSPIVPISITSNTTTDLGTQYAGLFNNPIIVSGIIKTSDGKPLAGRYVRAQTEPCLLGNDTREPNYCGPVKFLSQKTDSNGAYSISVRNPGKYYIVVSNTLGPVNSPNYQTTGKTAGPITVQAGDDITMDDIVYW
jgi:hypothetical protein